MDQKQTNTVRCPWCDHDEGAPLGSVTTPPYLKNLPLSGFPEQTCSSCGKTYLMDYCVKIKYSTRRLPCPDYHDHKFVLRNTAHHPGEPYLYDGKTWTLYICTKCDAEVILNQVYDGDVPLKLLPTIEDFKWASNYHHI